MEDDQVDDMLEIAEGKDIVEKREEQYALFYGGRNSEVEEIGAAEDPL
jgi:hypothetical protein